MIVYKGILKEMNYLDLVILCITETVSTKNFEILTVALSLGTLVPERSISSISTRVIMVLKNCPQGLPLKFQGASFGAIKFFWGKIFIGSLTGSGPEIKIIIYSSYVFRPNVTYMACC